MDGMLSDNTFNSRLLAGRYRYTAKLLQLDRCRPSTARPVLAAMAGVKSPLSLSLRAWRERLRSHPDREFAEYVLSGLEHGFRIGFDYQTRLSSARQNMPSAAEHPEVVERYITDERTAGRILGPVGKEQLPGLQVNRFGVIPKGRASNKWRLITDLSFPDGGSVNDGVSPELCSFQYTSVDRVARAAHRLGPGALLAKADIKAAYRLVPVHPEDRPLLGMQWQGQYFIDARLPFGLRSAPIIFTAVADALEWCVRQRGVVGIDHYLDDYIIVAQPGSPRCQAQLVAFEEECTELGVTLAPEKTEGPTTKLVFLGIEVDSVTGRLSLPADKLARLRSELQSWVSRRACRRRELESLVGVLQNAAKVIRPGRTFVRRMIDLLKGPRRPHYFIRLNQQFRADLYWWRTFAETWNGVALFPPPPAPTVEFASDASGSWGCGAWCGEQWWQWQWPELLLDIHGTWISPDWTRRFVTTAC